MTIALLFHTAGVDDLAEANCIPPAHIHTETNAHDGADNMYESQHLQQCTALGRAHHY